MKLKMTLYEESQKLENEIQVVLRLLEKESGGGIKNLGLIVILQDLQTKRDDLNAVRSYFDP